MPQAIILHGTDETPERYWYPWLANSLRSRGYDVDVPFYPDINKVPLPAFLPQVLANAALDDTTVLIGHSSGGPLVLSLLEQTDVSIAQAILVAGFASPLPSGHDPILQDSYDWAKIRAHVKDLYFINSINDPWGCDGAQGRAMFEQLGGTLIIRSDGHFGSGTNNQPYPTFELLDRLIP